MKRYFEVIGRRQVLLLEVDPPASTASTEELSEALKMDLKEIDRYHYAALKKEYSQ